nr:serine protease 53-like [Aedes albopictus]
MTFVCVAEQDRSLNSVYFCTMEIVVALLVFLVVIDTQTEGASFFESVASSDYYLRNDVFDCASRYYPPNPPPTFDEFSSENFPAVAGGVRAFDGEYQHMVAIGWEFNDTIKYLCGGSIIHSKFILTAAHCSVPVNGISPTIVRAGDSDLGNNENDHLAVQRTILRIVRHPLHRHSRSYHDIALIELENDLTFNVHVSSACLWLESYVPSEPLQIVGFGETKLAHGPSMTLQKGQVSYQSTDVCDEALTSRRRIPNGLLESQFCASHDTMDTCQGDSGGPIEVTKIDMFRREIALIVGITSFGTACGDGSVGVYTKISHYIDWIEKETNQSYSYGSCAARMLETKFKLVEITQLSTDKPLPYVHLSKDRSDTREHGCMGTLIDDQFVVTSAHCAAHPTGAPQFIFIADHGEYVPIAEVILHPQYQQNVQTHNIALLRLGKFLKRTLKPACLAEQPQSAVKPSVSFLLNGFIMANENKFFKYFLRTFIPERDRCSASTNEICMKSYFPVIPTLCQISDGAPILIESPEGIPFLYGIVDKNNSACDGELRGTLVEPHRDWIKSVLQRFLRREVLIFT